MKRIFSMVATALGLLVLAVLLWMNLAPRDEVVGALLAFERSRAGLEEKSLDVDGLHVAYLEGGNGEPLVLLHGIGCDRYHWARVAPHLTSRFRVIAIDLPAFGASSRLADRHYTGEEQVGYLHTILGALGISSFHLGGNSMGGLVSLRYAVRDPEEVKSLWLLAPGGVGTGPSGELATLRPGDRIPLFARSPEEVDEVLAFAASDPPYLPAVMKAALGARGAADYELHSRIFHELNAEWAAAPLEKHAAGLRTRTRIVWGEEDRLLTVAGAETLHAALPNSSVVVLPHIGHVPQLEAPKVVADDYLAFIDGIARPKP